jgi:hypothetical protein
MGSARSMAPSLASHPPCFLRILKLHPHQNSFDHNTPCVRTMYFAVQPQVTTIPFEKRDWSIRERSG